MKKLEIAVNGDREEEMGHALLDSIHKVIQDYGGMEVSVRADTVTDSSVQKFGFCSRKQDRAEGMV